MPTAKVRRATKLRRTSSRSAKWERIGPVRAPALFIFTFAFMLAACGGEKDSGGKVAGSCAIQGNPVALPGALTRFPIPEGGRINATRTDPAGNTIYRGVLPGTLDDLRDFYEAQLPKHGYKLGEGDSEDHEAEADFTGHGGEGHFKLNDIVGCTDAVRLEVALR